MSGFRVYSRVGRNTAVSEPWWLWLIGGVFMSLLWLALALAAAACFLVAWAWPYFVRICDKHAERLIAWWRIRHPVAMSPRRAHAIGGSIVGLVVIFAATAVIVHAGSGGTSAAAVACITQAGFTSTDALGTARHSWQSDGMYVDEFGSTARATTVAGRGGLALDVAAASWSRRRTAANASGSRAA